MNGQALRIAFAGTPAFAAQHLQALLDSHSNVITVLTQPDRPSGRGRKPGSSAVKQLAEKYKIPVLQPESLKSSKAQGLLEPLAMDLMVVVAYGLLLPQAVLDIPRYGCINVHASLLPRWRGAAPIERAILAGDAETGITIMQMDAGLDTGDILLSLSTPIEPQDNSETLIARLIVLGCQGLHQILDQIRDEQLTPAPQDNDQSTYAGKLSKEDALIHWNSSAQEIQRQIAAFYPRSPAWCYMNTQRVRIIQSSPESGRFSSPPGTIVSADASGLLVSCRDSSLRIQRMQLPGKKPGHVRDILNARQDLFAVGSLFLERQAFPDEG